MEKTINFNKNSFVKRVKSMLAVDFRRILKSRLFYIMIGVALVVPILIVVMTTMMDGQVTVDPNTGKETVMEGFKNAWESIGTLSTAGGDMTTAGAGMSLTSMCNINLMFFGIAVFICLFVAEDFRTGYAKNLFTVRSKKSDYIISKTIFGWAVGALLLIAYFIGSMLGGAISSLPFTMEGFGVGNVIACMFAKIFLMGVFASIFVLISVATKQRSWLSILISLGGGMLLFMMIPMLTPIDAGFMHVFMCLAGGVIFSIGLGAISNIILKKTSLV